jgi:hypothetical protein
MSKKHNERNAGRKRHGEQRKQHKSIALEPYLIEAILEDPEFDNFSHGVETLIKRHLENKKRNNA